ncbi:MAG TPA: hypothetical protein VGM96_17490 [Reyranella sp.]|jgi:hypothetical protein
MTLDQFIRCLDTYGADFRRWPDKERTDGEHLRDASPDARQRWQAARQLDALFALDRASAADRVREAAITDAALRRIRNTPPRRSLDWRWLLTRPMGAALGATLAAGLIAGFYAGPVLHRPLHEVGPLAVNALLDGEEDLL